MDTPIARLMILCGALVGLAGPANAQDDPAPPPTTPPPAAEKLPGPVPIPKVDLGPRLKTTPKARLAAEPNITVVDSTVLPRDKDGIWVLSFAFKPVRLKEIDTPGKGRHTIHYLYWRVANRTGQPRMFVPQFTLVTDTGKRYEDVVIPQAVDLIQQREDPATPVYGAVSVVGILPPSTKEGVDDTITGVAIWEGVDPKADAFKIYVRGLSDGYQMVAPPAGVDAQPTARHKTLRLDFTRFGDDRKLNEREIQLGDPPYDWIYW